MPVIRRFFNELRRRQVLGVVAIYVGTAWVLVQVADTDAVQDMFRVDSRFVLLAVVAGFPFVLVAGWFYDLTKHGVYRTPPASADVSFDKRLQITDYGIIAVMAIMWVSVAFLLHKPPITDRSIAMLVFENRSGVQELQDFAEQLRGDLHTHLGRVATFLSISPASVDKIDRSWPATRIADHFRVAYLLTGTIDQAGTYVTVTPRLIDGKDGSIVWAGNPVIREPTLDALYDMRTEISMEIVSVLRKRLSDSESNALMKRRTASQAAFDAYRRGRDLLLRRSDGALESAASEFDKAIESDPRFAAAHAELAITLMLAADHSVLVDRGYDEARELIDRAMDLDPDLAETYAAQGLFLWTEGSIDEALEAFRRAIELNPTYEISYHWMASIYGSERGEYEEAFRLGRELVRRTPYDRMVFWNHVGGLIARSQTDEAQRRIDDMRVIDPIAADWSQQDIDGLDGNWAQEVLWALKLYDEWQDRMNYIVTWGLVSLDMPVEARRVAELGGRLDRELILTIGSKEERQRITRSLLKLDADPDDPKNVAIGVDLAVVGEYEASQPFLETWWRDWNRVVSGNGVGIAIQAQALVAARKHARPPSGSEEVIDALKTNVRRLRDAGITANSRAHSVDYLEGITLYLDGQFQEGLALIAEATENGFFLPPPEAFAFQESLGRDPLFRKLLEKQAARQARERKKVLDVVCVDNPYAGTWDPLDETCEDYR